MKRYEYIDQELLLIEANNIFKDCPNKTKVIDTINEMFDSPHNVNMSSYSISISFLYNSSATQFELSFVSKLADEMASRITSNMKLN